MDNGYPDSYPIDIHRGRALLTAYGAYVEDNVQTVPGDSQRILTDIAAVLASDYPELSFMEIAQKALDRLESGND